MEFALIQSLNTWRLTEKILEIELFRRYIYSLTLSSVPVKVRVNKVEIVISF